MIVEFTKTIEELVKVLAYS